MKLAMFLVAIFWGGLACKKGGYPGFGSGDQGEAPADAATVAEGASSHKRVALTGAGLETAQFDCTAESPALVRFDPEAGTMLYCHEGQWVEMPPSAMVSKVPGLKKIEKELERKGKHKGQGRRKDHAGQEGGHERPGKRHRSFFCRPTPGIADSYVCMKNPQFTPPGGHGEPAQAHAKD